MHYTDYSSKDSGVGKKKTTEFDAIIDSDEANSCVTKYIGVGDSKYDITFQERVKIPEDERGGGGWSENVDDIRGWPYCLLAPDGSPPVPRPTPC